MPAICPRSDPITVTSRMVQTAYGGIRVKNFRLKFNTQSTALTACTKQLTSQHTALNSPMATANNNSQYLTQLFGGGTNSAGALAINK
jgi:hypothetical protein